MAMNSFFKKVFSYMNPSVNPNIEPAFTEWQQHLPTLWLLGKTGAGKSTLIQALTGNSAVEIGNGFKPCTQTAHSYHYPADNPLLCFLDTRGLSEADYDPHEDIQACKDRSHALIVVLKAEEPEQSDVLNALKQIKKSGDIKHFLIVHTAISSLGSHTEQQQAILHNQTQIEHVLGGGVQSIQADFSPETGDVIGLDTLKITLAEMLPILSLFTNTQAHISREEGNFNKLKTEVLWYAGAAGASDAIPAVGFISVPAIQGKMLHSLGNQYGIEWTKQDFIEFIGTLGTGFMVQYLSKLGIRQLVKFIPAYGQTIGSATAAAMSFSSTYAIGRAACKYLYHKSKDESVTKEEMKAVFEQAFESIKNVAETEMHKTDTLEKRQSKHTSDMKSELKQGKR